MVARLFGVGLILMTSSVRALAAQYRDIGDAGIVAVLAVNVDSVCRSPCPVWVVDSAIRRTPELFPARPIAPSFPTILHLSKVQLAAFARPGRSIIAADSNTWISEKPDTAMVGFSLIADMATVTPPYHFGVFILPPRNYSVVVWCVDVDSIENRWQATKVTLCYEM